MFTFNKKDIFNYHEGLFNRISQTFLNVTNNLVFLTGKHVLFHILKVMHKHLILILYW